MRDYNLDLDDFCYEAHHINKVFEEIEKNFMGYFDRYIASRGGIVATNEAIDSLKVKMNTNSNIKVLIDSSKLQKNLEVIKNNAIKEFNKDVEEYEELFDLDTLEEYAEDSAGFKNDLKRDCSMIRKTLNSKDKSLDQFKIKFNVCNANYLLEVMTNIATYLNEYPEKWDGYDYNGDYKIENLIDDDLLEQSTLDTTGYGVDGVIGGGIKSYIAHKLLPQYFPHRSREAIWALWYLTDKKDFGCEQDSEFLMILTDKVVTQQNFYYPYQLFGIYSYLIYCLLLEKYNELGVHFSEKYRYVFVNDFLKFVAKCHEGEIAELTRNIREEWV
ncbi:hypothetical protein [Lysinibacillus sp. G01H]|uniref:hypothetical protein n=1 Tax=Lysinibacillus sp. G01H TaxID=3026425 RepID=UPI00237EA7A1|nr:hypothetical protein [Lysinibacillus sp. G01H]WDU78841.1 hypothetical protein PSR12_19685 [Lysinibacillus sp. G01H]